MDDIMQQHYSITSREKRNMEIKMLGYGRDRMTLNRDDIDV